MTPQLVELETIDKYVLNQMPAGDKLVFEAKILVDNDLAHTVAAQRKAHKLLRLFARKQQRIRLEQLYQISLQDKAFSKSLQTIFS